MIKINQSIILLEHNVAVREQLGEALKKENEYDLTYVGEDIFNLLFGTGAIVNFEDGVFNVTTK